VSDANESDPPYCEWRQTKQNGVVTLALAHHSVELDDAWYRALDTSHLLQRKLKRRAAATATTTAAAESEAELEALRLGREHGGLAFLSNGLCLCADPPPSTTLMVVDSATGQAVERRVTTTIASATAQRYAEVIRQHMPPAPVDRATFSRWRAGDVIRCVLDLTHGRAHCTMTITRSPSAGASSSAATTTATSSSACAPAAAALHTAAATAESDWPLQVHVPCERWAMEPNSLYFWTLSLQSGVGPTRVTVLGS
jgi:hypothetical protein